MPIVPAGLSTSTPVPLAWRVKWTPNGGPGTPEGTVPAVQAPCSPFHSAPTRNPEQAAIQTGSALLGSALTTVFGFQVLIASPLPAPQRFEITATITTVYSLVVWSDLDVAIDATYRRNEE